jgi:NADPH:quinone reductase-like Zn-dependent oxidoreductase
VIKVSLIKVCNSINLVQDEIDEKKAQSQNIHYARMIVESSKIGLNTIADMLELNQLQVTIDSVFSLDDAKKAMIKSESTRATGKIVIEVAVN